MGLIRNHYVGRTFIEPRQSIRHFGVRVKLNPVRSILEGQRVVLVDDSIVRGTTSRKIVKIVRAAGAREVHMRISCPPTISPCFYGVDTPRRSELIAATHTLARSEVHRADGIGYRASKLLSPSARGVGVLRVLLCRQCPVAFRATKRPTFSTLKLDTDAVSNSVLMYAPSRFAAAASVHGQAGGSPAVGERNRNPFPQGNQAAIDRWRSRVLIR
jgi:hypothetical protein